MYLKIQSKEQREEKVVISVNNAGTEKMDIERKDELLIKYEQNMNSVDELEGFAESSFALKQKDDAQRMHVADPWELQQLNETKKRN